MKQLLLIVLLAGLAGPVLSQQRVSQPASKNEVLQEKYCSSLFSTAHGEYFDLLDDRTTASAISYLNILDWLQGRVAGLQIFTARDLTRVPIIRNQLATVYVDEFRVSYDYLNSLPVADIAMIKIIKGPFVGNPGSAGGTIAIYTIRDDDEP